MYNWSYRNYLMGISLCLLLSCANSDTQSEDQPAAIVKDSIPEQVIVKDENAVVFDSLSYEWEDGYLKLPWSLLAKVDFNKVYDDSIGADVDYPIFSDSLKLMNGRAVEVSGYIIPMEETGDETIVILSAFPYSQCFFCGLAGPESVIDVLPKDKMKRFKMDAQTTLRGRLRLNDTDLRYLYYILDDAELK